MKNWLKKYWSYSLNIVFLIVVVIVIWPEKEISADLSIYTQNDLTKSASINPGMGTEEVLAIMGEPAIKEISGETEEFHYCKTGHLVDEYISIEVNQGVVVSMSYYVVNWLDVAFHHTSTPNKHLLEIGGMGDCKLTIRWGTYGEKAPNKSMQPTAKASAD